jgi:hypothetical protein|tara:strand:- start:1160 stop:1378 length:219 start_codon:yes stop_codon:yes gene_type:complete
MTKELNRVFKLRKSVKKNLTLGESIKELKSLANGIDEYHIVNPTSQVVYKLIDIIKILKIIEIPQLLEEYNN